MMSLSGSFGVAVLLEDGFELLDALLAPGLGERVHDLRAHAERIEEHVDGRDGQVG